jgi:hypothetical protein
MTVTAVQIVKQAVKKNHQSNEIPDHGHVLTKRHLFIHKNYS